VPIFCTVTGCSVLLCVLLGCSGVDLRGETALHEVFGASPVESDVAVYIDREAVAVDGLARSMVMSLAPDLLRPQKLTEGAQSVTRISVNDGASLVCARAGFSLESFLSVDGKPQDLNVETYGQYRVIRAQGVGIYARLGGGWFAGGWGDVYAIIDVLEGKRKSLASLIAQVAGLDFGSNVVLACFLRPGLTEDDVREVFMGECALSMLARGLLTSSDAEWVAVIVSIREGRSVVEVFLAEDRQAK
jgi:hypothetical protein